MIAIIGGGGTLLEAAEQDDGCVPTGAVVGKEVSSSRISHPCRIGIVWRSGGDAVICFCMPARTQGGGRTLSVAAYSGGGGDEKGSWRKL